MTEEILHKVEGRIKWFNMFKGFGFVEIQGIPEDVFLHFSVIDKTKMEQLNNNDIILCNIAKTDKGYQVSEIITLLQSGKYEVKDDGPKQFSAIVKWFNPSKGFGFAQIESGKDVFIHSSILKKRKLASIEPGEKIELIARRTNLGYEAIDIIL